MRLCWNCEGRITMSEEICHLCGVSVIPASLDNPGKLFTPPYQFDTTSGNAIPDSPYKEMQAEEPEKNQEETVSTGSFNRSLLAVVSLSSGTFFFLFSLAMMIFSRDGVFTLQWDGSWWFIYGGLSIPMLIFGWSVMSKLDD